MAQASGQSEEQGKHKVLAVLPPGGKAAENPAYTCCVENALGLREFLDGKNCELFVTDDKEGDNSELDKHLADIEILVTTPFHPAYMTEERISAAKNLKLILTAGIGSDHVDLPAAADAGLTVAEVTGSNIVSVAEDEILRILLLQRNWLPAHEQVAAGEWDVPAVAGNAFDLQGATVGTVGSGGIGTEVLKRLKPWDITMLYHGRKEKDHLKELGAEFCADLDEMLGRCDIVTINVPLSEKTRGMFDAERLGKMKKGAILVNNARGAIVDQQAIVDACKSGQLKGYSGDTWPQQPAPKDHPWRHMKNQAMTPHTSGTTLQAQERYREGTQTMIGQWLNGDKFEDSNYIVREGKLAEQYT